MLEIPSIGFRESINKNNVDIHILADWIEASCLLGTKTVSKSDVVDVLIEQHVTDSQDIGYEIADSGWMEIESRLGRSGPSPSLRLHNLELEAIGTWQADIARSFLLVLSIMEAQPKWAAAHRHTPSQGDLFERLAAEACAHLFMGWQTERAGWSAANARRVPQLVADLSALLGTSGHADPAQWAGKSANDAGLDLICYRTFNDGRECIPLYMLQCASGANWTKKLNEPSPNVWMKLLDSAYQPMRGMVIPFVVNHQEMQQRCAVIEGPLFDRIRLLSPAAGSSSWVSGQLAADLEEWLTPRIQTLPWG